MIDSFIAGERSSIPTMGVVPSRLSAGTMSALTGQIVNTR